MTSVSDGFASEQMGVNREMLSYDSLKRSEPLSRQVKLRRQAESGYLHATVLQELLHRRTGHS